MSRVGNRLRVYVLWSMCALLGSVQPVWADRVPPPRASVELLPSPSCPQPALQSAFDAKAEALRDCLRSDYSMGKATLSCSFDGEGKVKSCAVSSVEGRFSKDKQSCLQKTLGTLSISKESWGSLRPSQCVAKVSAEMNRPPRRRPSREIDLGF